jgi:hypothetical protein
VIVRGRGSSSTDLLGEVDALEPLGETYGPRFSESSRVGRTEVPLESELVEGQEYRVLYVDIAGRWHETAFKLIDDEFESRLAMRRHASEVPHWVRERSQIVSGEVL